MLLEVNKLSTEGFMLDRKMALLLVFDLIFICYWNLLRVFCAHFLLYLVIIDGDSFCANLLRLASSSNQCYLCMWVS